MKEQKVSTYLLLTIAAFLVMLLELVVIEFGFFDRALATGQVSFALQHWVMSCVIWGFGIIFLLRMAKKEQGFDIFESNTR